MKKAIFLLGLLILLVVSVSIVTADNDSSDILSIADDVDDDIDLEEISADSDDSSKISKETKKKVSSSDKKDKLSDEDVITVDQGFKVKKVWKGDKESDRPSEIEFNLKLNGETWGEEPYKLDKENDWETFVEADLTADDKVEIEEVEVPGYTSEVTGNAKDGFTITNTLDEDDNETATDDDTSDDDTSDDTSDDSQPEKTTTTTTTTKVVKKQPEKAKDKHNTGNPILLGVLAVSVAGLAYQLRRKE